jgi:WD40 repeat protein
MEIGEYKLDLARRIEPSLGATFVRKGDALLVARETEDGGFEIELIQLVDKSKPHARTAVEGVTAVTRVGEEAVLLKIRPDRRDKTANRNQRKLEVRGLNDFRVITSIMEEKPGYITAHPDGAQIAVAHDFGPLHIWDAGTGQLISKYVSKGVGGVAYSNDGALLAAKEFKGALKIFDATKPGEGPLRSTAVGSGEAQIAFHPRQHVVAAAGKNAIKIVDADTARVTASIKTTKKESQGAIGQMGYSPDGKLLVTATLSDSVVGLWDTEKAEFIGHVLELGTPLSGVEFDARGEYLLISSYEAAELYTISRP